MLLGRLDAREKVVGTPKSSLCVTSVGHGHTIVTGLLLWRTNKADPF